MPKHFSEPDSPAPLRRRRATGEDRVFDNGYDPRQDFADSEYGQGTYGQDAYGQDQYRDQAATRGQGTGYGQGNGARRGSYTQTPYVQPPYAQDPYAKGGHGQQQDPYTQGAYGRQQDPYAESNYVEQEAPGAYEPSPYTDDEPRRGRGASSPRRQGKQKRRWPVALAAVLVVAVVGIGAYLFFNPPFYKVSVNGTEQTIEAGTTVQGIVDKGLATPTAGNLIAVDGSVAQQGGGTAFTATVNGADAQGDQKLSAGDQVQIDNGQDVDEDFTETTEAIPHGESGTDYSTLASYYNGAIHVYSSGEDGEKTVKTGNVSGKTVEEVTKQPTDAGYSSYNANVGDDKVLALTFDDGPWPNQTAEILDILKENGAHATFFQIGNQVAENAEVEKRIVAEGNQVASHTWDHAAGSGQGVNMTYMSADEQRAEMEKGFKAIEDTLGTSIEHVMRAPGGNYYGSLIDNLKDIVDVEVGWDVDTEDWRRPGAAAIEQAILSAKPGDVVLMHDGGGDRSQTIEGLRNALPKLVQEGYKFVTIDQLMAYGK